ncbi:MAG: ribonuclease Z [Vulcanimicrobiota bacterium]
MGSGTVDPQPHRACSGYHLETTAGGLLLDLGNGALRQAVRSGLQVHRVERLFLSHLHPDHTADLVPFLFARNYAPPPWDASPELTVFGPAGTAALLEGLYTAWPSVAPKEGKPGVRVREFEEGEVWTLGGVSLQALRVEHGDMEAYAFRVEEQGRVLCYSGDTRLCPGIEKAARGAHLFVSECSCFPRGCEPLYCREVHLSWEDVAEICEQARPQRLLLTHLYEPVLASRPNPLESLQKALDISVSLAEDGLVAEV